jgi:hypothetical protein
LAFRYDDENNYYITRANALELGHGSEALVRRIYGHLGTVRHRAKVVEHRVEQHKKVLKEQLDALRSGAGEH